MFSWPCLMTKSGPARPGKGGRRLSYQPAVEPLEARCLLSNLPPPWADKDIGYTGITGGAAQANNIYTVQGSGDDIFDTRDAFHFVYQPLGGDGQIAARVTGVENTDAWAGVSTIMAWAAWGERLARIITPALAQASVFSTPVTRAAIWPSPPSGW